MIRCKTSCGVHVTLLLVGFFCGGSPVQAADIALDWPEVQRPALFPAGQRVACIGDSITRPGQYIAYLYDFYATRRPDQPIRLYNFGIGGDTLADALERYDYDIKAVPCDRAVILLGMNDAYRGGYVPGSEADAVIVGRRASVIATYDQRLGMLLDRLTTDHLTPILCTPTIYDEVTISKCPLTQHGDQALMALAKVVKTRATVGGYSLIELHAPLLAVNGTLHATDPAASIIGGDRVHPTDAGQAVMAWAFLRQQGASAEIAAVAIDAGTRTIASARNAVVEDLKIAPDQVSFRYLPAALPLPVDKGWAAAAACIPPEQFLNSESLTITGLASGTWILSIGGVEVARPSAAELAAGINMAVLPKTPQREAANAIHARNIARQAIEQSIRAVHYVESKVLKMPSGAPAEIWQEKIAAWLASPEYQKRPANDYLKQAGARFAQDKPRRQALYQDLEATTVAMYSAFPRSGWQVQLVRHSALKVP